MQTLEASYMELLSILNLVDLSETKLVPKKRKKARHDRKTTAIRVLQMCSYVIVMQGASKNGGHQLKNDFGILYITALCMLLSPTFRLMSLIFLFKCLAHSNFFMCQTEI